MKTELLRQKHKQKENKIKEEDEREERQRHIRKPIGEGWRGVVPATSESKFTQNG